MTDEIRIKANQLAKSIEDAEAMENIVAAMTEHPDAMVSIECREAGVIRMKADEIFSALNYIRDVLHDRKEQLEDEYRML